MKAKDSATGRVRPPLHTPSAGLWWGALGVVAFSFTMPFTRVAVEGGAMSPLFVGSARAVLAALLAGVALAVTRQRVPRGAQWFRVGIVAAGAVAGFPLLTSFALTRVPASHGVVVVALLPAMTAVMAVVRAGERPPRRFWVAAGLGAVAAVAFAAAQHGGLGAAGAPDLLLFAAVIVCAIAYAEGGLLSRELGAWQTIAWALVLAAPLMLVLTGVAVADRPPEGTAREWAAFAYLGIVSMFLGFVAWYRGLAIGPIARVGQVQLMQPVLSIVWAGLILHESIPWTTVVGGAVVVSCALLAVRTRSATVRRAAVRTAARKDARGPA